MLKERTRVVTDTCNLAGAITFLETVLKGDIVRNMHNGVVFNLAMMYDLATHNAKEKKRTLQALAERYLLRTPDMA